MIIVSITIIKDLINPMTLNTLGTRTNIRNSDSSIIDKKMASSMVMDSDHPITITRRNDGASGKPNQVTELQRHDNRMTEDERLETVGRYGDVRELRVEGDEEGDVP